MQNVVATTIFNQLGGQRFILMTGAHSFTADGDSLTFKMPKAKDGIFACKIILDADDTYTMQFWKRRDTLDCSLHSEVDDVYADSMHAVFTHATGLFCSL